MKQAHALSKSRYQEWVLSGKPLKHSHPLKVTYKDAKHAFCREFRKLRRNEIEDFYKSMDPSNPNIFHLVRKKLGISKASTSHLEVQDQLFQDRALPEAWALYFESLFSPDPHKYDPSHFTLMRKSNGLQVPQIMLMI